MAIWKCSKVLDLVWHKEVTVGYSLESGCLRLQPKEGGKPHLRLNTTMRPIANKYREGKLQRTLKREFKRA
uniref:Bm31 n=1 Tax=Brugia malayi TaxID=6279 RepID=A0A0J9XLZ0_BRUMA|nr:Bm31 [Brugia malayi]